MTKEAKIKLLNARAEIARQIADLKRRRDEIALGAASASLSSAGGSKSYTNHALAEITALIEAKTQEYVALGRRLSGTAGIRHVVTTRR